MKSKVHIGIMSKQDYKKWTIAIAKGEYTPKIDEPKIWFESMKSMAKVLSNENQVLLLKTIMVKRQRSFTELEALTGRKKSDLSRILKTLERYGIVELIKEKRVITPVVKATGFRIEIGLESAA